MTPVVYYVCLLFTVCRTLLTPECCYMLYRDPWRNVVSSHYACVHSCSWQWSSLEPWALKRPAIINWFLQTQIEIPAVWSFFLHAELPLANGVDQSEIRVSLRGLHELISIFWTDQWEAVFTLPGFRGTSCGGKEDQRAESRDSSLSECPDRLSSTDTAGSRDLTSLTWFLNRATFFIRIFLFSSNYIYLLLWKDLTYQ